jgi:Tol biopolymer transport system component
VTHNTARLTSALAERYHLERELGAGGMATVYLAEDVRHRRKVALKVLRPELAAVIGAERFLKEIEVTANLQHPHILPLHDSGEADSFLFYVMPYVEGESLRARLERDRQLGIPEAVELTRQAASALDYAHRHGVIHRDIKPENILIHDGQALIADFGIALAVSTASGSRMTETGMSLGTPHYMSPEQAMGDRAVDARSDVYALGCVLYEMLVGEPPFTGPTAQAIVAKVITEKPSLVTAGRDTAPAHVAAAVQKALAKLPADRFASAAEFADALGNPRFALHDATRTGATPAAASPARPSPAVVAGLGLAALGLAFWLGGRVLAPAPVLHPVFRTTLPLGASVTPVDGQGNTIAFSPDGARLAFLGVDAQRVRRLFLRSLDRADPVPVPGTEGAVQPFFSPDGLWLGFLQEGKLRKVALAGGAAVTIAEVGQLQGASWSRNDRIVFASRGRLLRVAAAGGTPEVLAAPDSNALGAYRWPETLEDGNTVIFTLVRAEPVLAALALPEGSITELGQPGMSPRYVEGGHLVFTQSDGTVFAASFDPTRVRLTGAPEPIAEGVRLGGADVAKLGVSKSGSVAYLTGSGQAQRELVMVDLQGRLTVLPTPLDRYAGPRFSPDGRRLAVSVQHSTRPMHSDVWIWDMTRQTMLRLTSDSASSASDWSPDSRRIILSRGFGVTRFGVVWMATDGSGASDSLVGGPAIRVAARLTPDGKNVVFQELDARSQGTVSWDIWIAPVDTPSAARPLLRTRFSEQNAAISPDGRWLAYQSNETGANAIYVRPLTEAGGRVRVSVAGGIAPHWSRDGRELVYRNGDSLYAVSVTPGAELGFGPPRLLLALNENMSGYDVHPDGQRFLFVRQHSRGENNIDLVLNWFENRRTPRR